jgi:hypothetical protein
MRSLRIFFLFVFCVCAAAQNPVPYSALATGSQALPPNSSLKIAQGDFTLSPAGLFSGQAFIGYGWSEVISMTIDRALNPSDAGSRLFELTPGPVALPHDGNYGGWLFWANYEMTPSDQADLLSGRLYLDVQTSGLPLGEVRGQIVLVPEPHIIATILVGGILIAVCNGVHRKVRLATN